MRNYLLILFLLCNATVALSQDIIVFRKNDEEIKCRILAMNDSLFAYRLWQSEDTTSHIVKRFDVQSYMLDKHSKKSKAFVDKDVMTNADIDLLGEYRGGSIVPGYIIKNNNETVQGYVEVKNVALNQLEIRFMDSTGKVNVYSINDALGYGYGKVQYEKIKTGYRKKITNGRKTPDGYQFVHLAVDGPSKLYRFYTLKFKSGTMVSYEKNPPSYLGKLKREFVITNPKGQKVFTKGRTLKGAINRIYFDYPKYKARYPVDATKASELPEVINKFNLWFESNQ